MFNFDEMVSRFLVREKKPKTIGRYYPSEIGNCLRKTWYSYKYPQQVDPEKLKIFEVGNILHGFVVEVLKSEKNKEIELLKSEFPLKIETPDFVVSGRVDDLVLVKESGRNIVVEVKSIKSIDFVQKPDPKHEMQLQLYMHATGIHNGAVLYIDKTNLKSKVFPEGYNQKKAEEIMQRFGELHRLLTADLLPPAEAKKAQDMQWMCKYCEYAEKCKKNEE